MKRSVLIGFVLAGILLLWVTPRLSPPVFSQAASAEAPHIGEGGLPQFEKDPAWPKVPAKWRMGFGSAVAIDADDHVWILSRPHGLHPGQVARRSTAAPPVMEFDNAGQLHPGLGRGERAGISMAVQRARHHRGLQGLRVDHGKRGWQQRTIPRIFRTTTRFSSSPRPANS